MMKRAFSMLVAWGFIVAALACAAAGGEVKSPAADANSRAQASDANAPAARLALATYNMNYSVRDRAALAAYVRIIRKARPDVLAIQEGNGAVFDHLKKALAREYPHRLVYADANGGPAGFAWFSNLPLHKPVVLPRSFGWFTTPTVRVRPGGRELLLVNVHLRATIPPKGADFRRMLRELAATEAVRARETRFIHSRLPAGVPTVLLGDFNTISALQVPTFLGGKGFVDSFASVTPKADTRPSWRWVREGRRWGLRIDYIWHDSRFKTVRSRIVADGPSDHYPVVSELELLPEPAGASSGGSKR